jgi:hypothetical protein
MPMRMLTRLPLIALVLVAGCAAPAAQQATSSDAPAIRSMTLYRSPDCSCCHLWADIARDAGWTVATADVLDMTAFKTDHGVPPSAASCHTTIVGEYLVEGHVPMAALERLLAEAPDIDGIALPGMPAGSPGMGGAQERPFEVLAIRDGEVSPFGSY